MKMKQKILSEWKGIDELLGVNPKKLSEVHQKKYMALKSLLIKESEFFRRGLNIPDTTSELLTENTKVNVKTVKELTENRLIELCNKNKKIAKKMSECDVNKDTKTKLKAKLEMLVLGDVIEYISEQKKFQLDDLGMIISKQLIEAYIDSLVEFSK